MQNLLLRRQDSVHNTNLSAHDSDLSRRPGIVHVSSQMLRTHHIVSTTISLQGNKVTGKCKINKYIFSLIKTIITTQNYRKVPHLSGDDGDLRYGGFSERIQQLGTMSDDAIVLLVSSYNINV